MTEADQISCDVLVIGGGIAGIRAAIEAHDLGSDVILVNKAAFGKDGASTWMAGAGYEVALYPPDRLDLHLRDTIAGGKYLVNQKLVKALLTLGPQTASELSKWGVRFKKNDDGTFYQDLLPGHGFGRSLFLKHRGLYGGPEFKQALTNQVRRRKGIKVLEDVLTTDLLTRNGAVVGATAIDLADGTFKVVSAKSTILATGGLMQCYKLTDAGATCTGDGHAMAYRAGAKLLDMEFVQFMPAVAIWPPSVYADITPYSLHVSLCGIFYNKRAERFMERYYPKEKDWATRDATSKAIASEIKAGRGSLHGGIYLAFNHVPRNLVDIYLENNKTSPFIMKLKQAGVDLHEEAIEVAPAAHYTQGGCQINEKCETSLEGLYAIGEAGGGKDGADRLAGNALPCCMAMGIVSGGEAARRAKTAKLPKPDPHQIDSCKAIAFAPLKRKSGVRPIEVKNRIREVMEASAMFSRNRESLEAGIKALCDIKDNDLPRLATTAKNTTLNMDWADALEARGMVDAAEMVCRAALFRTETRGAHERSDYPASSSAWLKNIVIAGGADGAMQLTAEPVAFPHLKPGE